MNIKNGFVYVLFALISIGAKAQGELVDYQRADSIKQAFAKVYHSPSSFNWIKDTEKFWYQMKTEKGEEYMQVIVSERHKQSLFDQERLALLLSNETYDTIKAYQLPISRVQLEEKGKLMKFQAKGYHWEYDLEDEMLVKKEKVETRGGYWGTRWSDREGEPVVSPDKTKEAYIREHNVWVKDLSSKESTQLSFDGSPGNYYAADIQWSPDSKKLATYSVRPAEVRKLTLLESSPEDQLQPKLQTRDYVKPGDALPVKRPVLFHVIERKIVPISDELIQNHFSLSRIIWREDSRAFTFEYNQRGHQVYRVLEVNAASGSIRPLIEEQSETFIDYSGKKFRMDLEDGKEIIWASERDGWRHLYLYDGESGTVKNQITKGNWVVREVMHVDKEKRQIYFLASGMDKKEDPYHLHLCKVGLDGKGFQQITTEEANHSISFSDNLTYFIDVFSTQDMAPVAQLKEVSSGKVLMEIEEADITQLETAGWKAPEIFSAKGRDGKTNIWGLIIKPSNFDPEKSYPVIEYIYAGPHSSFVPKSFAPNYRGLNELAELGFIVVQIDGMGTSNRSKAFHDVCWKNLKDAGFPDRILWMQEAAKTRPYMDLDRVGIFGTSAGGQSSTGALLFHPEFYKVAVSSCGCHDNRMDKIWWNEQWMGYPIGKHYEECSNVVNAKNLEGKLMLIVGEVDDNVDPSSTYQLVNQLIKHDKNFDFLMVPGMGHSSGGEYGEHKRRDFFVKNLIGIDPPAWEDF
ncbi:DPP IV N-terminal domain-containing protein [Echinicola sp. CAU 1574]|uniref:DPP IV N-terminal domain-containing protein n=1 Tax=Echinicola arenosa TaxID=2774144 RepID=A0ABR9AM69_9BACT|nr:S9 family peptidase [Echinicola arenosa]MBD8488990.1 DPP IV N-terminal domain-containing protein [Echinicola arenosa]